MKTTSLKIIYLKDYELKEAIIQHLEQCGYKDLAQHLKTRLSKQQIKQQSNIKIHLKS